MKFSSRLIQILFLLLKTDQPIPAGILAQHIQISKRTVFRELEHIDRQLAGYELTLDTKSKKGISITGAESGKKELLDLLERSELNYPQNREDRCDQLIQELLWQEEPNKLYYYASKFRVSETTISNDLEKIEPWFYKNHIQIVKKSGVGIYLKYAEPDYRKACMRYIYQNMEDPFLILYRFAGKEVADKISVSIQMADSTKLDSMAETSRTDLLIYLCIMIYRISKNKRILSAVPLTKEERQSADFSLAEWFVDYLSHSFGLKIPEAELTYLYICLKGTKLQHMSDESLDGSFYDLECVIYEMIHQYDPKIALQLKHDEILIKGLVTHLRPTIVRIQYGIAIHNPFQSEILTQYPEVYQKTIRAVGVLERVIGPEVPPEETGLLALHFGGAQVRLNNREKLLKKIVVGVICASGIGISALMVSRISHAFHGQIHVKSLALWDIENGIPADIELLVTSFKIPDATYEYLQVNPMLTEADLTAISEQIEVITRELPSGADEPNERDRDVISKIDEIEMISREIGSILKNLEVYQARADSSFAEMVRLAGEIADGEGGLSDLICEDLMRREALSTQVIPEFKLTLLHAKTKGVSNSRFFVICPDTGVFLDPHFMESTVVVVLFIASGDPRETLAISTISQALFENDRFFDEICAGRKEQIKKYTEKLLRTYLQDKVNAIGI